MSSRHLLCITLFLTACGEVPSGGGTGGGSGGGTGTLNGVFQPNPNGLSFENYTNDGITNLTPVELRRMFGDGVCASLAGGTCTLTPAAAQWMSQVNAALNGGHCFGISQFVTGVLNGSIDPQQFGGPNAFALMKGNEALQREIAYWAATQFTSPGNAAMLAPKTGPNEVLNQLTEGWARGELFTVAFYLRAGGGGHAVTPMAVRSRMDGKSELTLYDNNFPNTERVLVVDPAANSWSYSASINPTAPASQYDGDATSKNLFATPLKNAQQPQQCPFCGMASAGAAMSGPRLVAESGGADVMISDVDDQGNSLGHSIGTTGQVLKNEFPGASVIAPLTADLYRDDGEPQYLIPGGSHLSITLSGAQLEAAATQQLAVIGQGYALAVLNVALQPMQQDLLIVTKTGDGLAYVTSAAQTPVVLHGFSTPAGAFTVAAQVASDGAGNTFALERDAMTLKLRFAGLRAATQYGFVIQRATAASVQQFLHQGESLAGNATLVIDLSSWPGDGQPLAVGVDMGSDGSIEQVLMLSDQG